MFERTFPEYGRVDALVVRMTETGAHVTPVNANVRRKAERVFAKAMRV
jgi:glycine cleavage system regulatory protein